MGDKSDIKYFISVKVVSRIYSIFELGRLKAQVGMGAAPIVDSDQHALVRMLIRVFDRRSMGSQGFIVSSGRTVLL